MGFTVHRVSGLPSTYEGWTRKFDALKRATNRIVIKKNMEVWNTHRGFEVSYYGGRFALITPEWMQLWANGHDNSPSTVNLFNSVSPASIGRHYGAPAFETTLRVNDYPFFDGIRVLFDGTVHPEDIRSDFVERVKPEVSKAYTKVMNFIKASLRTRWEIGEFADENYRCGNHTTAVRQALVIVDHCEPKPEFISHQDVVFVIAPVWCSMSGWERAQSGDWDFFMKNVREHYRRDYYIAHDGYYKEEFKNV